MRKSNERPLLTLAIPTFNRLGCLRLLVDTVIHQVQSADVLGKGFEILISNNASTDGTADYLEGLADIQGVRVIHQNSNIGLGGNLLFCCQAAKGQYLWIMGDDDLPLDGAVIAVLECLERDQPDLLYLPALGMPGDLSGQAKIKIRSKNTSVFDSMGLAVRSSIYVTFISSWIVNIDSYNNYVCPPVLDRFRDTLFPQLEWILTLLKQGRKLSCANDNWLVARAGNSGGYSVFEVFSVQYNRIVDEKLADNPQLHRFFRRCMLWCFIPGLVWGVRKNAIGNFGEFDKEKVMSILKSAYGNNIFFLLIIIPMIKFNLPIARCFKLMASVWAKGWLLLSRKRQSVVSLNNVR